MRMAFIMDPIDRILIDRDTTFVFMLEAQARGHTLYYLGVEDLLIEQGRPRARCRRIEVRRAREHYSLFEEQLESLDSFHVVFMRKDPPFDLEYYFATQILTLIDTRRTFIINHPRGLREANEKLYPLQFPALMPPTLVSRDLTHLKGFLDSRPM